MMNSVFVEFQRIRGKNKERALWFNSSYLIQNSDTPWRLSTFKAQNLTMNYQPGNILVVDDIPENLKLLVGMLKQLNFIYNWLFVMVQASGQQEKRALVQ